MDQPKNAFSVLAPELLALLVEHVTPLMPTHVPYHSGIHADPDDLSRHEREFWEALKAQRRDILNLSLVSREFREFCEPYLWRHAIIQSDADLGVLAQTLRLRPSLGKHLRSICLSIKPTFSRRYFSNEAEMSTLVWSSPNVEDILVVVANHHPSFDFQNFEFQKALPDVYRYAAGALALREQGGVDPRPLAAPPLPRLKSLRFRHAIEHPMRFGQLEMDTIPIIPLITTLETLELWGDGWQSWCNVFNRPPKAPPLDPELDQIEFPFLGPHYPRMLKIKNIRLFGTQACEYHVANLALACPRLEDLEVKFVGLYFPCDGVQRGQAPWDPAPGVGDGNNATGDGQNGNVQAVNWNYEWDIDAEEDPALVAIPPSRVLRARSGTLKSLSITCCGCEAYLGPQLPKGQDERPREDHCTLDLAPLTNLEHLTIDLWALVGNTPSLELRDIDRITSRIPLSLVSLKLSMNWDMDRQFRGWSNREALHIHELMIVAAAATRLFKDEARRIRDFSLVHPWFPENPSARRVFDSILDDLRAEALSAGVWNIETADPTGWCYCNHPSTQYVRYTAQSRRHVLRKRAANRFGSDMQDGDWDVFL